MGQVGGGRWLGRTQDARSSGNCQSQQVCKCTEQAAGSQKPPEHFNAEARKLST